MLLLTSLLLRTSLFQAVRTIELPKLPNDWIGQFPGIELKKQAFLEELH